MTAAEAEAALRAAGFVEDSAEAVETLSRLQDAGSHFPEPLFLAWRQLVTLQQWAADTEPRHSRSSGLAADTLQLALLAQQQRSRIVSLIWDCDQRPLPAPPAPLQRLRRAAMSAEGAKIAERLDAEQAKAHDEAEAAYTAALQAAESAPPSRFTAGLYKNVKEELQRAIAAQALLVNKLVHLVVTQRRLEAVEWPS